MIHRRILRIHQLSLTKRLCTFKTVDLSTPHLWFDSARKLKRNIICHVGPTNSGKTHNALEALKKSSKGLYCGPLRLLAWEVCETLRKASIKCNLLTGNERDFYDEGGTHTASTVEMASLNQDYEVAVIDEAQLIGDQSRGWAWTQAILGIRAGELHLCGSATMLPIITELARLTGDKLEIKQYERLSTLTCENEPLRSFSDVMPGDCVVGFSRRSLFEMKKLIEQNNRKLRCCVIYGGLPPKARKQQASLFSDPASGYNVLVASDAVGMGLNLCIRRIVFSSMEKFDGKKTRLLTTAEVKQIAGRAGRYGSRYEHGWTSCVDSDDMEELRDRLQAQDKCVQRAGLFPTLEQLLILSALLKHRVTEPSLMAFWRDYLLRYGEINDLNKFESNETDGMDLVPELNQGMLAKHFGSAENFIESIDAYFSRQRTSSAITTHDDDTCITDQSSNTTLEDAVLEQEKSPKKTNQRRGKKKTSYSMGSSLHSETNSSKALAQSRSLVHLLTLYRRHADLDPSGLYFLCNLQEVMNMAHELDEEPLMSLEDKYAWSLAPVNLDNNMLKKVFRVFIKEFSRYGEVNLPKFSDLRAPTNSHAMLHLESLHQVYELYIWLSMRYPMNFLHVAEAKSQRDKCTDLIEVGLSNLGQNTFKKRYYREKREVHRMMNVQDSQDDNFVSQPETK